MKLKYYMRGIGIGMLVTTIILVVAFKLTGGNLSDDEIKSKAKKLGMVENTSTIEEASKDNNSEQADKSKENSNDSNASLDNASGADKANENVNVTVTDPQAVTKNTAETVQFTVNPGESSRMVVERLAQQGIISDAYAFNKFLNEQGKDNNIQPGTFTVPKNISDNDLATLLSTKQKFRQ